MRLAAIVVAALFLPIVRPLAAQFIRVSPATDTTALTHMGRTMHAGSLTRQEAVEGSSQLGSVVRTGAAGAVTGGILGFLVGGAMNFDAEVEELGGQTDDSCVDKNCAQIGAVIGMAAGFVLGAAYGVEGSSMLASAVRASAAGALLGGAAGVLVGGAMNIGADVANLQGQTDDPCSDKDCAQMGAVIGTAAGFVLGAAVGAVLSKRRPSSGQANVIMVRLRSGKLGVGASVRF